MREALRIDERMLEGYLGLGDPVADLLNGATCDGDDAFASQRWLRDSPPKRAIWHELYGDLLEPGPRRTVLDVGGGYSALTRLLAARQDYTLLDFMAHDDHGALRRVEAGLESFWTAADWLAAESVPAADVVVANDLFPNVDQRLELFLARFLPYCAELRLSLTVYNRPRFYTAKRVDGEEMLVVLAWDGEQTRRALARSGAEIPAAALAALSQPGESVFPNGREVVTVKLRGGAPA